MRLRQIGLINPYQAERSRLDGYPPQLDEATTDPMQMTPAALMLWLWCVASWRVQITAAFGIDYIPDGEITGVGFTGSGTADFTIDSDGTLQYEGLRKNPGDDDIEMNLLHRLSFYASAVEASGTGDLDGCGFVFELGFGITRYIGPLWVPAYRLSLFGDTIVLNTRTSGGEMDPDGNFTFSLGDDPDTLTGTVTIRPKTYYEYLDANGLNPIWDAATGAQLSEPRIDTL